MFGRYFISRIYFFGGFMEVLGLKVLEIKVYFVALKRKFGN